MLKLFLSFLLVVASSLSLSPLIPALLGIKGNIVSILMCFFFLLIILRLQIGFKRMVVILLFFSAIIFSLAIYLKKLFLIKYFSIFLFIFLLFKLFNNNKNKLYSFYNSVKYLINDLIDTSAKIKINFKVFFFIFIAILFGLLNSFYWGNFTGRVLIYFILALMIASYASKDLMIKYIDMISRLHLWVLFLSIPGFLYAYYGGSAIFSIPNEDGRINSFYLSTFSNTYLNGFIRPSGFYDEPGALSFYLCMIVALRDTFCLDRKKSWQLLLFGFITTSLAHVIFVFFYAIHTGIIRKKNILLIFSIIAILTLIAYSIDSPLSSILLKLFSRFEIIDGRFAGDNRMYLLLNAISHLNFVVAIFGLDGACILNSSECISNQFVQYGENPLTLMVHWGLSLSWPYYLSLLYLLIKAGGANRYLVLGIFFILLQRPNLMSYGYSIIIMLFIYSLCKFKFDTSRGSFNA